MKATVTKYQIITADSWRIIECGFNSWLDAYNYAMMIDYGQFENEGGLMIIPYTL